MKLDAKGSTHYYDTSKYQRHTEDISRSPTYIVAPFQQSRKTAIFATRMKSITRIVYMDLNQAHVVNGGTLSKLKLRKSPQEHCKTTRSDEISEIVAIGFS